jgi:PAS domain S-box-containing protein
VKTTGRPRLTREKATAGDGTNLRARLAIAEETLRAIHSGEVDSMVVAGKQGDRVFTLEGAEHAYRVLIESMNEGALTLTAGKMILYANQCFARMVKCPLEQVTGSSFRRFLSVADRETLRPLMKRSARTGSKLQVTLIAEDGSLLPVQISIQELARKGFDRVTISIVVTDLTEAHRNQELLRALTHRVVQVQESERGRIALELHDNITQLLCAVMFRSQALVDALSPRDAKAKREATKLHTMLGRTAGEVERISRDLRPNLLDQLGLAATIKSHASRFATRTGVHVALIDQPLPTPLPGGMQLALYRIAQEAFRNIEKHARAREVKVSLVEMRGVIVLTIKDDGIGFDALQHAARGEGQDVLGLLGMSERATAEGGVLTVKSGRRAGTEIEARIPLPLDVLTARKSA